MNSAAKDSFRARARWGLIAVVALMISACSPAPTPACDERRPDGVQRSCGGDGECATYLKCIEGRCALPPTMSGEREATTVDLVVRPAAGERPMAEFSAEVASTELERRRGLSWRPCMQPGWAMLFVYAEPDEVVFQTRDMTFDLDLAFVDDDQTIVELHRRIPAGSTADFASSGPIRYVLETRAGDLDGVSEGDVVEWSGANGANSL